MKLLLFCDQHDEDYQVFEWTENGQTCTECPICVAEEILADYSECFYNPNQKHNKRLQ